MKINSILNTNFKSNSIKKAANTSFSSKIKTQEDKDSFSSNSKTKHNGKRAAIALAAFLTALNTVSCSSKTAALDESATIQPAITIENNENENKKTIEIYYNNDGTQTILTQTQTPFGTNVITAEKLPDDIEINSKGEVINDDNQEYKSKKTKVVLTDKKDVSNITIEQQNSYKHYWEDIDTNGYSDYFEQISADGEIFTLEAKDTIFGYNTATVQEPDSDTPREIYFDFYEEFPYKPDIMSLVAQDELSEMLPEEYDVEKLVPKSPAQYSFEEKKNKEENENY